MRAIYAPTGPAREYAELGLNVYLGCSHGCRYCYAGPTMKQTREFHQAEARPKKGLLADLRADLAACGPDTPRVHLSFLSDPWQPEEAERGLTREALTMFRQARVPVQTLTKAGQLPRRDFDILAACDTWFGVSLSWTDDADRAAWEPGAGSVTERMFLLRDAKAAGMRTWVSVEPVVDPAQALDVIRHLTPWVDEWRVGKLTKHEAANGVDWRTFASECLDLLRSTGRDYLLKDSLAPFLPRDAALRRGA